MPDSHRYPHSRGKPDRQQARPPSSADEMLLAGKVEEQCEDGLPWVFLSSRID
jgi:hypothetical protein|tara:strand:- start:1105 stop:1263 length:159 start_codon:yes stop_codon:yes gene_type:complete